MDLLADERRIILKGPLKRKGTASESTSELQVYVLDHCLLVIKSKYFDNMEKFKLYKKVIHSNQRCEKFTEMKLGDFEAYTISIACYIITR